jgi:enoyl-CoA hydratase/carnithine racemase
MMIDLVRLEPGPNYVSLILNRPDKRNALNWELITAIEHAIHQAERIPGARAILVRGEGKGFSAGIDLLGFPELQGYFGEGWQANLIPVSEAMQAILTRFERSPLPTIALIHGFCLGMGFELALACDMRIAVEGSRIGLPETRVGLIPDVGGTTRLTRILGPARAKEYILTGKEIPLDRAEDWGLVNRIVAEGDLLNAGATLAGEIAEAAPLAVTYAKRVIDQLADIERGHQYEAWAQAILIRSEDFGIGAQAAMVKSKPGWKGK